LPDSSPNDLPSAYEYFLRQRLSADARLVELVGNNTRTGFPNIYFDVAEEGHGDVVITYSYAGRSENHGDMPAETVFADCDFLVVARGPRARSDDIRQAARRIRAALHQQEGDTPDGTVLHSEETHSVVLPTYEDTDHNLHTGRGGYYNLWVQPPS
jgi:hypothetical protein